MPREGGYQGKNWSIQPALHDGVTALLDADDLSFNFHRNDEDSGAVREYDSNIMGRFICNNRKCTTGAWSSKMIAVTIRMYSNIEYNARVYHQRCRGCLRVGRPILHASYAERVAYRLKKWSGVAVDVPFYSGESNGPHESSLCEGCKSGHCAQTFWV